jgi:hypothetical protein
MWRNGKVVRSETMPAPAARAQERIDTFFLDMDKLFETFAT